jgi:hypothetical protein
METNTTFPKELQSMRGSTAYCAAVAKPPLSLYAAKLTYYGAMECN